MSYCMFSQLPSRHNDISPTTTMNQRLKECAFCCPQLTLVYFVVCLFCLFAECLPLLSEARLESLLSWTNPGGAMPLPRTAGVVVQPRRPGLALRLSSSPLSLLLPFIILLSSPLSSICGPLGTATMSVCLFICPAHQLATSNHLVCYLAS